MATFFRVTEALFLSTALLNYAQASVSSHDDKQQVFSGLDFAAIHGQFEKTRAQTLKPKDAPPASAGTAATVGQPGDDQARPDTPAVRLTLLSEMAQGSALNINSRNLQEADCSDGANSLLVTSTVFPLMEGCLSPSVVDGTLVYESDTAAILYVEPSDTADPPFWAALYLNTSGDFTVACLSLENADLVDPSETPWYCDVDGDGSEFLLADAELSVSCGCSITSPSPMVTAAPAPSTTVSACGDGDSFSIVSETLPVTEGCYLDTALFSHDQVVYTISGTEDVGQMWMVALEVSGDGTSAGDVHWFVVNVASTGEADDSDFYCVSDVEAAFYHPSEVPSWTCIEGVAIDVACGCLGSPSPGPPSPGPSPVSPSTPTPIAQPVAPPSAQPAGGSEPELNTCPGDGSFTITANAAPELGGCFTGSTRSDGLFMYTVSGTTTQYEASVITLEADDGNVYWYLGFISVSEDSSGDTQLYCFSLETATDADPGDTSWSCDFTGNAANFLTVTEEDLSIVCGSCTSTLQPAASPLPPPTPTPVSSISQGTPTPVAPPTTPTAAESTPTPSRSPAGGSEPELNTCPGDGSFTITANAAPELGGCFTGSTRSDGLFMYTVSGTTTQYEASVITLEDDEGNAFWYLGFISVSEDSSGDTQLYCFSLETASDADPGDASWSCDFTGNAANFLTATEEDLSIVCGSCTSTLQPAASPLPPPTPTPVSSTSQRTPTPVAPPTTPTAAESTPIPSRSPISASESPSVADTCSGDGSFTITANANPNLDGCFKDTGSSTELYSVSGTDTQSEVFVGGLESDEGNFVWVIGFVPIDDETEETLLYCVSAESASDVNPGNASWICDFTGNSANFLAASEVDISISCGSCAETVTGGDTQDSSQASTLGVGVVAAGGAGMVAVASVFAGWC